MKWLKIAFGLLVLLVVPVGHAAASVDDFTISNYQIDYALSKDAENRSTLRTVETITAQFPDYDQNHGIERAIPKRYRDHKVRLDVVSVKNAAGGYWGYTTYTSNDNFVVRIGDADRYVHGAQTYIITYTQRDVTNYFSDTNDDEFYWDTNGTQWRVPIQRLAVTVHLDSVLTSSLSGHSACYIGESGSNTQCQLTRDGSAFFASGENLAPGQNITLAIGFKPATFQPYQQTTWEKLFPYVLAGWIVLWLVGFGLIIYVSMKYFSVVNRKKELTVIPPEYLPPKDTSVTTAASIVRSPRAAFAAQLLDFAVRHYLKLYEVKATGFLSFRSKDYEIEIVRDTNDLKAEEREILRDIFGGEPAVGARLKLSTLRNNTTVYKRIVDNDSKLKTLVRGEYGLRVKDTARTKWFRKLSFVLFVLGVVTLSPLIITAALFAFVYSFMVWTLTDKGLELSRYLRGLKDYIEMAEKDRLKALQSPEGAEKVGGVDTADSAQLVKLYERVLPYAVLFGQEKEWNKRIGELYEAAGAQPDWYSGRAAFNAAAFGSAMHSFSTKASYSAASSSSSGGSSGGGFSGGGGGGGGGGGW